jgi:hypothetical protein
VPRLFNNVTEKGYKVNRLGMSLSKYRYLILVMVFDSEIWQQLLPFGLWQMLKLGYWFVWIKEIYGGR